MIRKTEDPPGQVKRRRPIWPAASLAALLLASCGGGADVDSEAGSPPDPAPAAQGRSSAPADLPAAEDDAPRPVRVEIPAIGVSARVTELGLNRDGTLEVPKDYSVTGWWSGGPEPGERGAAVIAGHVDSKTGPAVFYELEELERGDEVLIHRSDASAIRFVVSGVERHGKDEFPTQRVYGATDAPALRLVTCSGSFNEDTGHYEDNTIVFADGARAVR